MPESEPRNFVEKMFYSLIYVFDAPGEWIREKFVLPNQKNYPWYHQKFRRVPTIDQCYDGDSVCYFEANCQYKRDRQVDDNILSILRQRFENCVFYESPDHEDKCKVLLKQYEEATLNWYIKYGDLGSYHNVRRAYMKQKHRMIWERRHGPVGTGMKEQKKEGDIEL